MFFQQLSDKQLFVVICSSFYDMSSRTNPLVITYRLDCSRYDVTFINKANVTSAS